MKNNQFRFFFSGKIVTSLAGNFTMENALFKNIFLHKIFICQPIFKIFVALFKTFGMQNGDMLIFFLRSFRKLRLRKMQFLKDGVQTVVCVGPGHKPKLLVFSLTDSVIIKLKLLICKNLCLYRTDFHF